MKKIISLMLMLMIITSLAACTKPKSQEGQKTESFTEKADGTVSEDSYSKNDSANHTSDTTTNSSNPLWESDKMENISNKTSTSTDNSTGSSEAQDPKVDSIILYEYETIDATVAHVQSFYKNTKYTVSDLTYTNIYALHNHGGVVGKWVDFEWKYSADLKVKSAQFLLSTNKDMKNATVSDVKNKETKFSVANLYTDTYYYWQVRVTTTDGKVLTSKIAKTKTNTGRRIIYLDGIKNVRDLGGITTKNGQKLKQGLIYRSTQIDFTNNDYSPITQNGINIARNVLKIKTDLDIRNASERGTSINNKSPLGNDINYINIPSKQYSDFYASTRANEGNIIRTFANYDNYPIFFHCAHGADRTGTVAYILEALVGVENDELSKDYELTGWRKRIDNDFVNLTNASLSKELVGDNLQEKTEYFLNEKLGLSEMEISNIKNILLTDSAIFRSDSLSAPVKKQGDVIEFNIDFRSSKEISSVKCGTTALSFEKTKNGISIDVSSAKSKNGVITFNDGSVLKFEW